MCPKQFPCPRYIRCKPGTYLSPRLILTQYKLKQASTRHTLPRSTIWVCPKRFPCTWYIRRKPCTYLTPKTNTISKRTKTSFHLTYITLDYHSGVPKVIAMPDVHSAQTVHLSYAETNTITKRTKTTPLDIHYLRVPFGCAQSNFHARGTFGANRAPILRQD